MIDDEITIGFKTFMRPKKLEKAFDSMEKLEIKPKKIIVADDSPKFSFRSMNKTIIDNKKNNNNNLNIEYIELEDDIGLAKGRNQIVDQVNTKFFFLMDDDHMLRKDILDLKRLIKLDKKIGGVSILLKTNEKPENLARDIRTEKNYVIFEKNEPKEHYKYKGLKYKYYDFIPNIGLFRTKMLKNHPWDENYIIGCEHADYYLNHYLNTDWKFINSSSLVVDHYPGGNKAYRKHRMSHEKISDSMDYFTQKWDYKGYFHNEGTGNTSLPTKIIRKLPYPIRWKAKKELIRWMS